MMISSRVMEILSEDPDPEPDRHSEAAGNVRSYAVDVLVEPSPLVQEILHGGVPRSTDLCTAVTECVTAVATEFVLVGEIEVLLTGSQQIRDLNTQFRGIDADTDVLTFPSSHSELGYTPANEVPLLAGSIAISVPYAQCQAELRQVSLLDELLMLAIHGALHLAGFDDVEESDRREMQAQMSRFATLLNLPPEPSWESVLHENDPEHQESESEARELPSGNLSSDNGSARELVESQILGGPSRE